MKVTDRFSLGRLVSTPGANDAMDAAGVSPFDLLARHRAGDWGDLDDEDKQANEAALRFGSRLLSSYNLPGSGRIWLITEADRSASTFLLPDEY